MPNTATALAQRGSQSAISGDVRRQRAHCLNQVTIGCLTPTQVVELAQHDHNHALRGLSISQVLDAQPGWGSTTTRRCLTRLFTVLQVPSSARRRVKVGWLLDGRAGDDRLTEFLRAVDPAVRPGWVGFPYRNPEHGGKS